MIQKTPNKGWGESTVSVVCVKSRISYIFKGSSRVRRKFPPIPTLESMQESILWMLMVRPEAGEYDILP